MTAFIGYPNDRGICDRCMHTHSDCVCPPPRERFSVQAEPDPDRSGGWQIAVLTVPLAVAVAFGWFLVYAYGS